MLSTSEILAYLEESMSIISKTDIDDIDMVINSLVETRDRAGRLFILGVGGSAATASHAVNDFRKLCGIEAYAPTDNVSELTARTNDDGWESWMVEWLKGSRLCTDDAILVISVGGGDAEKHVSECLVKAIDHARTTGATVLGMVGRDGGYTAKMADACVVIPPLYPDRVTPHTEGIASVILHLIVSHPTLQTAPAKWESTK